MSEQIGSARRIVVGVDGSAASLAALAWAASEAQLRHAQLHAVRAWEDVRRRPGPYAANDSSPSPDDRAAAASRLDSSVQAVLSAAPAADVRTELADGPAERVLLDRAAGAELLVLGRSGATGSCPPAGPVQRACLRRAPCPLVLV